ncbi:MAG: IclR family transcriptional regulator [Oscillospiraceae bacterium]
MQNNNMQSLYRALMILNTFTTSPVQRVSEISRSLNLTPSTVSRHLSTMLDMGFVERDDKSGCYRLGVQVLSLAGTILHSNELYRHAYPELQKLSFATNLHCFLGIPDKQDLVHLASVGADDSTELFTPIGYRHPMFCCAMGKVILAYRSEKEIEHILFSHPLKKLTPHTITNPAQIEKELQRVRMRGYVTIEEEVTIGKASLAAPIFNQNRVAIGAISISGCVSQLNLKDREESLARMVINVAGKISGKMGYFPR